MKFIAPYYYPIPDYYKYARRVRDIDQNNPYIYPLNSIEVKELQKILEKKEPKIIFNLGCERGDTEICISKVLWPKGNFFKIYSIDTWLGQWDSPILYDNRFSADEKFNTFLFNIKQNGYCPYVIPCRHSPLTWQAKLKASKEYCDLLVINMLRFSPVEAKCLLEAYINNLKSDGEIFCSHKNNEKMQKVAINFANKNKLKIIEKEFLCILKR